MNQWSQDMAMPSMAVIEASERTFLQRVFGWMTGGLALTGAVAWWAQSPSVVVPLVTSGGIWAVLIAYIGLFIGFQVAVAKAKAGLAATLFVIFSAVLGLFLAPVLAQYAHATIALAFLVSAGTFGVCALYGALTKVDLTSVGSLCRMALIGCIIAMLVNLFLGSAKLDWIITYVLLFVFIGLIAWRVQELKQYHRNGIEGGKADRAMAIGGAFVLYMSFINLFLIVLKILGRSRD